MSFIRHFVKPRANNNVLLALAVFAGFSYALMAILAYSPASQFNLDYFLDLKFYYSKEVFLNQMSLIDNHQIKMYQIIHFVDYLFILTFYPLLLLVMARFLNPNQLPIGWLSVVAMLSDLSENLIIDFHLYFDPIYFLAAISGILTAMKFSFLVMSILGLIIFRNKREKR